MAETQKGPKGGKDLNTVQRYLINHSTPEPHIVNELREATKHSPRSKMMTNSDQTVLFANICRIINAKKTLDIGVFTGMSALSVALALPPDGKVIACDVSEEYTNIGKPYWKKSGVMHKIDLRIKPALETLDELIRDGQSETFDFAFIDADKPNIKNYYMKCVELVRKGGVIGIDNVLLKGKVLDAECNENEAVCTRELNDFLVSDDRVWVTMLQIADGLTLAFKK